jgi:O-antigen/teichoic acid export membrane protein
MERLANFMHLRVLFRTLGLSALTACIVVIALPLYPRLLGREEWGQIALLLIAQTSASVLESGLFQAAVRDLALHPHRASMLARFWMPGYVVLSVVACLLALFFAWGMARTPLWTMLAFSFMAGMSIICALLNTLDIGTGHQHRTAARTALTTMARHGLGIMAAWLWPNLIGVVVVFLSVGVLEFLWVQRQLAHLSIDWLSIPWKQGLNWALRRAPWMLVASALGAWLSQADRLLAGYTLQPRDTGLYLIVAQYCMGLVQFQYPIQRELYKHFQLPRHRSDWLPFPRNVIVHTAALSALPPLIGAILAPWIFRWITMASPQDAALATHWAWILLACIFINAMGSITYMAISRLRMDKALAFSNLAGGLLGLAVFLFSRQFLPLYASAIYWLGLSIGLLTSSAGFLWYVRHRRL